MSEQEKYFTFAPSDILCNVKNLFYGTALSYGIKRNQIFGSDMSKNIDFITTSTDQFTSLGTGIIPFLEHDDANRALMGSNMQRQSLPLIVKEMPLLETGRERVIARESDATIVAKKSGRVIYSSTSKIVVEEVCKKSKFHNKNIFFQRLSNNGIFYKKKFPKKAHIIRTTYFLGNVKMSNHGTFLRKNSIVNKNDWIKVGQVLADNVGTLQGNLSFGKNILIGYLGWEGYNFEDAVVISEKLVLDDIFTSVHVKKHKTFFVVGGKKGVRIQKLVLLL